MIRKALLCIVLLAALLVVGGQVAAQEEGVVYAVLFYSPTCPHCHKVINEDLPPMQEEFGDRLQILFIDVRNQAGGQYLLNSCPVFGIPDTMCGSVPTMILGETAMVGSVQIPQQMPGLVRAGLEQGGIGFPAIPGIDAVFAEALAQRAESQTAGVVNAVMFYSPDCPHCHKVINEDLPPMEAEFGQNLQILFVNVDEEVGARLFLDACEPFNISDEFCGSVPTVILGDEVMVGSAEIPARMPGLVRAGMADGGVGLPGIPGIEVVAQQAQEVALSDDVTASSETGVCSGVAQACIARVGWQDRFSEDWFGNGLATGVLVALIGSVVVMSVAGARGSLDWLHHRTGWMVTLMVALVSVLVAATLMLQQEEFSLVSGLALGVAAALVVSAGIIWDSGEDGIPEWIFPLVVLAGLLVAGYMAYVEIGDESAVCGALGDCNLVQQSEYAELFGLIPIGALGVVGYVMIFGAWWLARNGSDYAGAALLGLLLFGVIFSAYLTFLEPFVIGAVCAWCLTSAMVTLLLLWLGASDGWESMRNLLRRESSKVAERQRA